MFLIVDTPGTYIGKKGDTFSIKKPGGGRQVISVRKVDCINILTKAQVTHDAFILAARYAIPIIFSVRGRPEAVFHCFASHGTVLARREQMLAYVDGRGVELAKKFVYAALENKARILLKLAKNRKLAGTVAYDVLMGKAMEIRAVIPQIYELEGDLAAIRQPLMGYEGKGAIAYFEAMKEVLAPFVQFYRRERRPPKDPVNSALSLGYTILNGQILIGIATAGLEPFAGFLHSDRSGKPSLALDMIEEFRQAVVDVVVLKLFVRRMVTAADFREEGGRILFGEKGKNVFYKELFEKIRRGSDEFKGQKFTYEQLILKQARHLVHYLIGKEREYTPFLLKW
ncbi:MAG: CRISPR-associated endonuclease Cas1 [Candidatus Helarchaeota archaeon]